MTEQPDKIRITFDDIERVQLSTPSTAGAAPTQSAVPSGVSKDWGTISSAATPDTEKGGIRRFLLKGWVYLALSGMAGAFLGWMICEPSFHDGSEEGVGNAFMIPLMVTLMCVGLAVAEAVVERSTQKAIQRGLLAVLLGIVFGFVFSFVGNIIFSIAVGMVMQGSNPSIENPAFWFGRAIAWMVFGICGGLVYGIVGRSTKQGLYGSIGGVLGAGVGGFLFDPISLLFGGAEPSRAIGMLIFGASTGAAIGLVESALKDRWLYVSGGPLAGKQFILYKPVTQLGSQQTCDIYLFKDTSILPHHATIALHGAQAILSVAGSTFVNGQPVTSARVLRSGDLIQIGRYTFQYQEKNQSR